jgi:hypothetical protein
LVLVEQVEHLVLLYVEEIKEVIQYLALLHQQVVVIQVRQELEVLVVEVDQVGHQTDFQLNLEVQVIHLL